MRNADDGSGVHPFRVIAAFGAASGDDLAEELDTDGLVRLNDLPRAREPHPVVEAFHLFAVDDLLAEHAVFVPHPVTDGGNVHRRHRIEEARGEASEATVAETGFGFEFSE